MTNRETPPELADWVAERADLLATTVRKILAEAEPKEGQPVQAWLIPLLEEFAHVESISKRAVHLLTAYALRTGMTTQTEIARVTNVTVPAAANRAASRLARETWQEVWPEKR
ncbi:hypothetical protein [Nocardia tengchongensis]|uniref:hypothetical protein n=1 Tax=Nocardia tengchongensis TaxID=2055889 RepID=UPI00369E45DE